MLYRCVALLTNIILTRRSARTPHRALRARWLAPASLNVRREDVETMDTQPLIRAWIEYHANPKEKTEEFWAWEQVDDAVWNNPEEGWSLILALIKEAPNNSILANVAAGPLEDLIVRHCEQFIDRIEEQARKDPKFRLCLTGVWCEGDIPESLYNRIQLYTSTVAEPL